MSSWKEMVRENWGGDEFPPELLSDSFKLATRDIAFEPCTTIEGISRQIAALKQPVGLVCWLAIDREKDGPRGLSVKMMAVNRSDA